MERLRALEVMIYAGKAMPRCFPASTTAVNPLTGCMLFEVPHSSIFLHHRWHAE